VEFVSKECFLCAAAAQFRFYFLANIFRATLIAEARCLFSLTLASKKNPNALSPSSPQSSLPNLVISLNLLQSMPAEHEIGADNGQDAQQFLHKVQDGIAAWRT